MNTHTAPQFEVFVKSDTFKFNAAHFVAFQNYRERLHGHNYNVSVKLIGEHRSNSGKVPSSSSSALYTPIIGADGYLIDFTMIKQITRQICKELNEHFICPIHSDVLDITTITMPNDTKPVPSSNDITRKEAIVTDAITATEYIQIHCTMDGTKFLFPKSDCILLPIVHATAEELAIYIYCQILHHITTDYLIARNIYVMEVSVAEAPTQEATFRYAIPTRSSDSSSGGDGKKETIDVRQFIMSGNIVPMPCLTDATTKTTTTPAAASTTEKRDRGTMFDSGTMTSDGTHGQTCDCCSSGNNNNHFQWQLQRVMDAIQDGRLIVASSSSSSNTNNAHNNTSNMTIQDIEQLLKS